VTPAPKLSVLARLLPSRPRRHLFAMATADVIVLSSSPPRSVIATTPPQGLVAMLSSSPGLPSPSMLMRTKRPSLVSASRAAQIPERAVAGFASAASLIKAGSPGLDPDARSGVRTTKGYGSLGPADKSGLDGGEKAKTKPKKRAPAGVEGAVAPKKSRAPSKKTKKDANTDGEVGQGPIHEEFRLPVKEKKPRKPRVRKDKDETQPKIKKGKITKPGTNDGIEKTAITKRSAAVITVSAIPDSGTNDLHVVSPPTAEQDLGLDEAVRRRKSWTPPKDTSRMTEPFNRGPGSTVESMDAAQGCPFEQPAKSFGNLCSSFGYDQPAESNFAPQVQRNIDGVALTKRRRIEASDSMRRITRLILTLNW